MSLHSAHRRPEWTAYLRNTCCVGAWLVCAACAGADDPIAASLAADAGLPPAPTAGPLGGLEAGTGANPTAVAPPVYDASVVAAPDPDPDGGCSKDVDLVFVMDISGSMLPFFEQLDTEIVAVDQTLASLALPGPHHYGLVVFVDDVEVTNGGAAYPNVEEIRRAFIDWQWAAGLNQVKASDQFNGSLVENSLDALHAAATQFQWRDKQTTHRMIVHVTDDTFWDGPGSPLQCEAPAQNGCATIGSMHSYQSVVAALRSQEIWTFAFAAHVRPLSFGFIDTSAGFFVDYRGMSSIPRATGGEAWEIIDVLLGAASLSQSINGAVLGKRCEAFPPVLL